MRLNQYKHGLIFVLPVHVSHPSWHFRHLNAFVLFDFFEPE
jgi:hypothetical protein